MAPAPDAGDPPGLRQQAMQLFETFVRLLDEAPAERQHTAFVMQLRELDLLKVGNLGLTLQASVRRLLLSGLKAKTLHVARGLHTAVLDSQSACIKGHSA